MNTNLINIPEYTADDYYNSSAPYEFLWEHRNDKFMLQQLIQKMKAKAGAVGVRSFMSLWNSYCEMVTQRQGIIVESSTNFEGQELELISGNYCCDERGVYLSDKFGYEICVCPHPIMPVRRLVNVDTGEERLEIAFKKGRIWRKIIVEKSVIASQSSIISLSANGVVVNSENAKLLSTYLLSMEQENYDLIDEERSIGRLGWIQGHGFSPFYDGLVFDGETNFKNLFNCVTSVGNYEVWKDTMRKVRGETIPARLALAASFSSVLLEPLGLLPFFLHIWGSSGVGKSVLLRIAASVWGSSRLGDLVLSFNSTGVGMEMLASCLNSIPLCLDELQIQNAAGIHDFDKIIYNLSEGIGRTRGAKTGGLQKQNTWRCCFITNGESPISNANSGGGAVNRVLEIEVEENIYSDLNGLCDIISDNYGFAGREFVEYLQSEGAIDRAYRMQKEFYRELMKFDSTEKQALSASAILTADTIVTELIFKDGNALTIEDMATIMTKKSEVDVNTRALDYLYEMIARNKIHFTTNDFDEYKYEVWGKDDYDCIYIIKSVFDREMANGGFNSSAFLAWAKRKGYIKCDANKRTKKSRIAGSAVNCVCVSKTEKQQTFEVISDFDEDLPL